MASTAKEIDTEFPSFIRLYKDGSVERLIDSPYTPPSLNQDPKTGDSAVSSKDITISQNPKISARLYLPKSTQPNRKIPILVYFHGGGFCLESAFSFFYHRYMNYQVSEAQVLAISVEYRLAPEHSLPAAYEDSWEALQWVASQFSGISDNDSQSEPWISDHGDFDRLFIGGDSAGGNIAHNIALRAGVEKLNNNVKILGALLANPYFWGSKAIGNESIENHDKSYSYLIWDFVYPSAPNGVDNPLVNPASSAIGGLAKLGCSKLLVCVASEDELRERGVWYYNLVKESGWKGEIELFEMEGEAHDFHIFDNFCESDNVEIMIKHLASFLNKI